MTTQITNTIVPKLPQQRTPQIINTKKSCNNTARNATTNQNNQQPSKNEDISKSREPSFQLLSPNDLLFSDEEGHFSKRPKHYIRIERPMQYVKINQWKSELHKKWPWQVNAHIEVLPNRKPKQSIRFPFHSCLLFFCMFRLGLLCLSCLSSLCLS